MASVRLRRPSCRSPGGDLPSPLVNAVWFSFTDAPLFGRAAKWIGLDNYHSLFDRDFGVVLVRTAIWLVLGVGGSLIVGVVMALLLEKPIRGRVVFRVILALPWIIPDAIAATMWRFALHPGFGIVNNVLLASHVIDQPVDFLSSDYALWTVIGIRIWKGAPFIFLAVLAGLQAIPREVEEAAFVDGATNWQRLRYIKIPMLAPVLWASGVILAAWTLVIFDLVFILTGGGPDGATEILSLRIYDAGFADGAMGLASAIAVVALGLTAIFSYFYVRREVRSSMP